MSTDNLPSFKFSSRSLLAGAAFAFAAFFSGCPSGGSGRTIIECGGGAKFRCPEGSFCELGPKCGGIDKKGQCSYQPTECPSEREVVCGCDNVEYDNECIANAAGITVAYLGPCMEKKR